jgi:hypothetical protein
MPTTEQVAASGPVGMVGVADVDRDAGAEGRHDGLVVEDPEARVGELAHLAVGHLADAVADLRHESRIDGVDRVDVREVLVAVGLERGGEDRPRDVGTTAREGGHGAVARHAEESGEDDDCLRLRGQLPTQRRGQPRVGLVAERGVAGLALEQHAGFGGMHVACGSAAGLERLRDQHGREILPRRLEQILEPSGIGAVAREPRAQVRLDPANNPGIEPQPLLDRRVAPDDLREESAGLAPRQRRVRAGDQQIRDLGVVPAALARGRNHDDTPRGIRQQDVTDLGHLPGIRQRGAAKLADLHSAFLPCAHGAAAARGPATSVKQSIIGAAAQSKTALQQNGTSALPADSI